MVSYVRKPPQPIDWYTGDQLINKFLSLGVLKSLIFYLISGTVVCIYLKNKEVYFSIKEKREKKLMYIKIYMYLTTTSLLANLLLFIVKALLFIKGNKLFSFYGKLSIGQVILFFFTCFFITLMINALVLLNSMLFKEGVLALLSPLFTVEIIIAVFGITTMFVSEQTGWFGNILALVNSGNIDNIIYSCIYGYRFETSDVNTQLIYILAMIFVTVLLTTLSYLSYMHIDGKKSKRLYYYEGIRVAWYIVMGTIICYLVTFTSSGIVALFKQDVTIEEGKYMFNIAFLISTPIFILLEYILYRVTGRERKVVIEDNEDIPV